MLKQSLLAVVAIASLTALAAPAPTSTTVDAAGVEVVARGAASSPGCQITPTLLGNGDAHTNTYHFALDYQRDRKPVNGNRKVPVSYTLPADVKFGFPTSKVLYTSDEANKGQTSMDVTIPKDFNCNDQWTPGVTLVCVKADIQVTAYTVHTGQKQCGFSQDKSFVMYSPLKDQPAPRLYCAAGDACLNWVDTGVANVDV